MAQRSPNFIYLYATKMVFPQSKSRNAGSEIVCNCLAPHISTLSSALEESLQGTQGKVEGTILGWFQGKSHRKPAVMDLLSSLFIF